MGREGAEVVFLCTHIVNGWSRVGQYLYLLFIFIEHQSRVVTSDQSKWNTTSLCWLLLELATNWLWTEWVDLWVTRRVDKRMIVWSTRSWGKDSSHRRKYDFYIFINLFSFLSLVYMYFPKWNPHFSFIAIFEQFLIEFYFTVACKVEKFYL